MAVGLGQPVDLRDVETELRNCRQRRGGGRRAGGENLNRVIKVASVRFCALTMAVQDNRRAAEMGDALVAMAS